MKKNPVLHQFEVVDGINIFYRVAGDKTKPAILLLNGFPSSSISFRELINDLKDDFYLVAPDYPAFGHSDMTNDWTYQYTFHNLSVTIEKFVDQLGLKKFALYAFDYGGPVGFRLASRRPELISALIVQNANAYKEGIGPAFAVAAPFLEHRTPETEKPIRELFTLDGIKFFYFHGAENPAVISPDGYISDMYFLSRPGAHDIHLELLQNYGTNIAEYPTWQAYFKKHQPPTLLVWGKNDPFFPLAAAEAFKTDLPNAKLKAYNTSHFALEEYHSEIAGDIREFMGTVK